jgi:hypothetical protein
VTKKIPLYPLLIASYPILALAARNIHEISVAAIWRPMLASLLLAGLICAVAELLLRDWHRTALVSSSVLLLILSYGQVYDAMLSIDIPGSPRYRHLALGSVWGLLLVLVILWAAKWLKEPSHWTPWLNLIGALLLIYPVFTIIASAPPRSAPAGIAWTPARAQVSDMNRPSVYYIILDSYARQDSLLRLYGYDNSAFISGLRQRGFYVAECSQSNYARTELSLTSSLNFDYLPLPGGDASDLTPPDALLHSKVRTFFEGLGYETVAFPTGFKWLEWSDANIYPLAPAKFSELSEFEVLFANTTVMRFPLDMGMLPAVGVSPNERARERTLNVLETLKRIPGYPGSYFVYAHIVSPHAPYVFDAEGNSVNTPDSQARASTLPTGSRAGTPHLRMDDESISIPAKASQAITTEPQTGYAGQAAFIGKEILDVVDALLQVSKVPPIIIIQGDHGAPTQNEEERMKNLSAYYLPGIDMGQVLYPSITPVNTFRVILDAYFGQGLPLLADQSFYSNSGNSGRFDPVPPSCPSQP